MKLKKKWVITTLVLILFIGAGIIYRITHNTPTGSTDPQSAPAARASSVLQVNGYIINEQPLTDVIYTTGSLMPDEEVDLSFETSGKIVSINFDEGSVVKKGQLLAKVNDKPLLAQLSRYEAQVKLAEDRVFRQGTLLEKDAVSQEALEQATTELAILNADMDLIKANISLTELRAPFDGIIGLRNVSEGAYASPNIIVATLTKTSPLKIDFSVPERYASQIKRGTNLTFTVDGILRTFNATVYATESRVDAGTRTLSIRALFPNTGGQLTPGRFANIVIKMIEISDAIAIPSQALIKEMGMDKVFVYRGGKAEPVGVDIGIRTDAEVQIIRGLNVGDTLITSGTLQLRTGLDVVLDNLE